MDDRQALERYRYLLRTAPPDDLERAHAEAFAQLTPDQRQQLLQELSRVVPPSEVGGSDPQSLARMATRAELRQPGTIERTVSAAPGLGSIFLYTLAGAFIGTAIADSLFGGPEADPGADSGADTGAEGTQADTGTGTEDLGDAGGDVGGDFGDFGGFDI